MAVVPRVERASAASVLVGEDLERCAGEVQPRCRLCDGQPIGRSQGNGRGRDVDTDRVRCRLKDLVTPGPVRITTLSWRLYLSWNKWNRWSIASSVEMASATFIAVNWAVF